MDESNTIGPGTLGFPADGIAFVLQSQSETALGTKGLGYEGIKPSVAVEFDIFRNPYDPNVPNVSLLTNGNLKKHLETSDTPLSFPLYGHTAVLAWIVYEATKKELSVYAAPWPLSALEKPERPAAPLFTYEVDLAKLLTAETFAGFTAGTGAGDAVQEVCGWQLASGALGETQLAAGNCSVPTPPPVPSPGQTAPGQTAALHLSTAQPPARLQPGHIHRLEYLHRHGHRHGHRRRRQPDGHGQLRERQRRESSARATVATSRRVKARRAHRAARSSSCRPGTPARRRRSRPATPATPVTPPAAGSPPTCPPARWARR